MKNEEKDRVPACAGAPQGGSPKQRCPHLDRAISLVQAARFVLALRDGATVAGAAEAAGVAVATLYYRRRIDADFAACWTDAVAGASAAVAAARAQACGALDNAQGTAVREHARRWLVRKRRRAVEFTRARRQAFLDHFAGSCNMAAAAAAAGVTVWTVRRALAQDPAFAAGLDDALAIGYPQAEEEALREAMAAQAAYHIAPSPEASALGFDRALAVLREYKRGFGKIGRRPYYRRPRLASFEEGFAALERELDALAAREKLKRPLPAAGAVAEAGPVAGAASGPRIRRL